MHQYYGTEIKKGSTFNRILRTLVLVKTLWKFKILRRNEMERKNPNPPAAQNQGQQQNVADPAIAVQMLLLQMQNRFEDLSNNILNKIDTMNTRIDSLEQTINVLHEQADKLKNDRDHATPNNPNDPNRTNKQ